jgi:uncharacterized membrane protein YfcA
LLAAAGLPALALGIFIGHRVTLRLSLPQFLRVLYVVLMGTGAALILKAAN